jgi:DNA-directed RNA polymerase specialized sigma subunit
LQKWQAIKANTIIETEKIENALDFICKGKGHALYKTILIMWYIDSKTFWEISCELNYSEIWIKKLKKEALKSLTVTLFGIDALRAI